MFKRKRDWNLPYCGLKIGDRVVDNYGNKATVTTLCEYDPNICYITFDNGVPHKESCDCIRLEGEKEPTDCIYVITTDKGTKVIEGYFKALFYIVFVIRNRYMLDSFLNTYPGASVVRLYWGNK